MSKIIELNSLLTKEGDLSKKAAWVSFKGIEFQIRYISKATVAAMAKNCFIVAFDPSTKGKTARLNADAFSQELCKTVILSWRKVTLGALANLMPLDIPEGQENTELPFTPTNVLTVVNNVHELDAFIQDCCTDASLFRHPEAGELEKNLSSSLTTTSAPEPSPATSA